MARLDVGSKAPAFTLRNQNGDKVALRSFAGTRVVLYFYPADDTPGCTKEACQFNDGLLAFKHLGVKVLGISPDDAPSHVAFRKKYDLQFDLLSDPDKDNAFGFFEVEQFLLKDLVLALALLETHQFQAFVFEEGPDGLDKGLRHGDGLFGRGKAVSQVAATKGGDVAFGGQLRHVGVQIHPVDAFEFQDDMFLLEFGEAVG